MTGPRPRVSVCIPARDAGAHLAGAITSALAQDVAGLEVVVCDDGSAEAVPAPHERRVRVLRHATARGVAAARTTCLAAARGELVAWLDADDAYVPGGLARQVAALDAHPEAVLVHGGYEVVDVAGRALPAWPAPFARDTVEPAAVAVRHLAAGNELATSTVVVRRGAHDAAGPFATDIGPSSTDWDMWLRLAHLGAVAYTARPIARYRQHAHTISRATTGDGARLRCDARVAARHGGPVAAAALAARALLFAGDATTRGARADALAAVALAAEHTAHRLDGLAGAIARGDDLACMRGTRAALGALGADLRGTRFGARVARIAAADPAWDAELRAAGGTVAAVTPPGAVVAAIAKWDPGLRIASGRAGCNYPDRALLPDGYPEDGVAAVAHLEALRARRGVTHLAVPATAAWWLEHYPALAARLGPALHRDSACAVFALDGAA